MIEILILAGGASSRMEGRDKLLEPVGGVPLLQHIVGEAEATGHPVTVALPADGAARAAVLGGSAARLLRLNAAREGQSGTLRDGVAALLSCEAFLVVLADLPDLTCDDFLAVIAARSSAPEALIWRGATQMGAPGHPILFDASLRPEFAELSGDEGGHSVVRRHADAVHLVTLPGNRALRDLDTPEDWAAWRRDTGL